jgi:hypothetical protein
MSLLRLIAFAKTEALSAFYDRYSRLVFSLALFILHDRRTPGSDPGCFLRIWRRLKPTAPSRPR